MTVGRYCDRGEPSKPNPHALHQILGRGEFHLFRFVSNFWELLENFPKSSELLLMLQFKLNQHISNGQ